METSVTENRNDDAATGSNDAELLVKLIGVLGHDAGKFEFVKSCQTAMAEHNRMSKRQFAIAHNVIKNHTKSKKMVEVIGVMYGHDSIVYKKVKSRYDTYGAFLGEQAKYVLDKIYEWTDGVDENVDRWMTYEKLNTIVPFNNNSK